MTFFAGPTIEKFHHYLKRTIPTLLPFGTSFLIQRRAESMSFPIRFLMKHHINGVQAENLSFQFGVNAHP